MIHIAIDVYTVHILNPLMDTKLSLKFDKIINFGKKQGQAPKKQWRMTPFWPHYLQKLTWRKHLFQEGWLEGGGE